MGRGAFGAAVYVLLSALGCSAPDGASDLASPPSASIPMEVPTAVATSKTPCEADEYDADDQGLPAHVTASYIDLARVRRVTKFRSGWGHDYSDEFETCRSMKHYFEPLGPDWTATQIYAPASGTVVRVYDEWV